MLLRLENELRWTSQVRFHLEVGFIKLAKIGFVRDIEDVLREVKSGSPMAAPPPPAPVRMPEPARRPEPPKISTPDNPKHERAPEPKPVEKPSPAASPDAYSFVDIFNRRVEEKSPITAVYVQKAERVERSGDDVRIIVANATQFSQLQSKEHKAVLDAAAGELVGKPVSVSLIMKESQSKDGSSVESAKDEPLVKRFLEVFRGDLAQVKPSKGE
jgi:hypothetical protein